MATWEDGPEYAPLVRPDAFTEPAVGPLPLAPPVPRPAAGAPTDRPVFGAPATPVAPLETLVPVPTDRRDPQLAFAVVSSTNTGGGPWGGVHGAAPAGAPFGPPTTAAAEPAGHQSAAAFPSAPGPAAALVPLPEPASPTGFPAPGTPQWFGPGPYGEQPADGRVDARAVWEAATPGLLIVLLVALFLKVLAPVLLVVAFLLARRVLVARLPVQRAFVIALGTVATFAVLGLFTGPLGFGDWWSFLGTWSRLVSLGVGVSTVLLVRAALLRGERPGPPAESATYRGPWG